MDCVNMNTRQIPITSSNKDIATLIANGDQKFSSLYTVGPVVDNKQYNFCAQRFHNYNQPLNAVSQLTWQTRLIPQRPINTRCSRVNHSLQAYVHDEYDFIEKHGEEYQNSPEGLDPESSLKTKRELHFDKLVAVTKPTPLPRTKRVINNSCFFKFAPDAADWTTEFRLKNQVDQLTQGSVNIDPFQLREAVPPVGTSFGPEIRPDIKLLIPPERGRYGPSDSRTEILGRMFNITTGDGSEEDNKYINDLVTKEKTLDSIDPAITDKTKNHLSQTSSSTSSDLVVKDQKGTTKKGGKQDIGLSKSSKTVKFKDDFQQTTSDLNVKKNTTDLVESEKNNLQHSSNLIDTQTEKENSNNSNISSKPLHFNALAVELCSPLWDKELLASANISSVKPKKPLKDIPLSPRRKPLAALYQKRAEPEPEKEDYAPEVYVAVADSYGTRIKQLSFYHPSTLSTGGIESISVATQCNYADIEASTKPKTLAKKDISLKSTPNKAQLSKSERIVNNTMLNTQPKRISDGGSFTLRMKHQQQTTILKNLSKSTKQQNTRLIHPPQLGYIDPFNTNYFQLLPDPGTNKATDIEKERWQRVNRTIPHLVLPKLQQHIPVIESKMSQNSFEDLDIKESLSDEDYSYISSELKEKPQEDTNKEFFKILNMTTAPIYRRLLNQCSSGQYLSTGLAACRGGHKIAKIVQHRIRTYGEDNRSPDRQKRILEAENQLLRYWKLCYPSSNIDIVGQRIKQTHLDLRPVQCRGRRQAARNNQITHTTIDRDSFTYYGKLISSPQKSEFDDTTLKSSIQTELKDSLVSQSSVQQPLLPPLIEPEDIGILLRFPIQETSVSHQQDLYNKHKEIINEKVRVPWDWESKVIRPTTTTTM